MEDVLIELRKTSIRGRMAFGITCLELACQAFTLDTPKLQQLINHLWSFTSSLDFSQWEEDLLDGVGGYFLEIYDNRHKLSRSSEVYSLNIIELILLLNLYIMSSRLAGAIYTVELVNIVSLP